MVKGKGIHGLFTNLQKAYETVLEGARICFQDKEHFKNKANSKTKKKKRLYLASKYKTFKFTCQ